MLAGCGRVGFDDRIAGAPDGSAADARPPACVQIAFDMPAAAITGTGPRALVVADLDGDGKPDVAVTNAGAASFSVLIGNGDGTFQPKRDYATQAEPYSIAVGDVTGDGKPDVVVGDYSANFLSVFVNNGDGTFQSQVDYPTGGGPQSVAIGDVDGDGKLDIVVANNIADTLTVMRNTGALTFVAGTPLAPLPGPYAAVILDLSGDGKPDLAVATTGSMMGGGGGVDVFIGNGDGTFQPKTDYTTGPLTQPWSIAAGDLDGDGAPDLAVANNYGNMASNETISVLINHGDGTFANHVDYASDPYPWWFDIAD